MNTYELCGKSYPVDGYVQTEKFGTVPVVGLRMMSEEEWNARGRCDFLRRYEAEHGPQQIFPETAYRAWGESIRQAMADELGKPVSVVYGGQGV